MPNATEYCPVSPLRVFKVNEPEKTGLSDAALVFN
jgi:hypothetical protein